MEEINRTTDTSNPPRNLAELIARSLAKLRGSQKETSSPKFHTLCETLRSYLRSGGAGGIVIFACHGSVAQVVVRMLMDHAHNGVIPLLAQHHGAELVKAKEAVEHGKFNVIVTTQLPVVLTLRAPVLIMFDELPCHLTQVLCRGATTNHLVRMVELGRLQATKFSYPLPSDAASQQWIVNVTRLDGIIPPPQINIRPSTESPSPSTHPRIQDATTAAWLPPSDALIIMHLVLQERSKSGVGVPGQRTVCFSERVETPREVCRVDIPGLNGFDKIEEYGHSKLEALVQACLSACQLLQMSGLLEPTHFPTVHPFAPTPRATDRKSVV